MFCLRTKATNDKDGFNIHQIHLPRLVFGSLSPALLGSPGIFVLFFFFKQFFPPEAINKWAFASGKYLARKDDKVKSDKKCQLGSPVW